MGMVYSHLFIVSFFFFFLLFFLYPKSPVPSRSKTIRQKLIEEKTCMWAGFRLMRTMSRRHHIPPRFDMCRPCHDGLDGTLTFRCLFLIEERKELLQTRRFEGFFRYVSPLLSNNTRTPLRLGPAGGHEG